MVTRILKFFSENVVNAGPVNKMNGNTCSEPGLKGFLSRMVSSPDSRIVTTQYFYSTGRRMVDFYVLITGKKLERRSHTESGYTGQVVDF